MVSVTDANHLKNFVWETEKESENGMERSLSFEKEKYKLNNDICYERIQQYFKSFSYKEVQLKWIT